MSRKTIILIAFLLYTCSIACFANIKDDINKLEQAVNTAVFNLQLLGTTDNFEQEAEIQLELAITSIRKSLLKEDYFAYSFYVVARHFKQYKAALNILIEISKKEEYKPLRRWVNERIKQTQRHAVGIPDREFSIKKEFDSIRNLLK